MEYRICITGDLGSGKSTVCRILCQRLSAQQYATGAVVRDLAAKMNLPIHELNAYIETHPEIDRQIDSDVERLNTCPGNLIVDSRMAWHFLGKDWFSVYLKVDIDTAAQRIMGAGRATERYEDAKTAVQRLIDRRNSENLRYKTLYGTDNTDMSHYNAVIDTTGITADQAADQIIAQYTQWFNGKNK